MDFDNVSSLWPGQLTKSEIHQLVLRFHAHAKADNDYQAQSIPIAIHLFTAQAITEKQIRHGWDDIIPKLQIRVVTVPGDHHSMMAEPHVELLGAALSREIKQISPIQSLARQDTVILHW